MDMWMYSTDRRLRKSEITELRGTRRCLSCQGFLLRLAERENYAPYHWIPTGYICSACNTMYLELA